MQVPGIANFSSFIEVFVAANLAYAGSKTFRAFLADDLLSLKQALSPRFADKKKDVESIVDILRADNPAIYATVCSRYDNDDADFKGVQSEVTSNAGAHVKLFPAALKPVFLMSGLYGLLVLFVCGFCIEGNKLNEHSLYLCVSGCLFIVPWAIWQFIRSFFVEWTLKWPRPFGTMKLLALFSIVMPCLIWYGPAAGFFLSDSGERFLFGMMVAAIVAAYFLYFIRAFIHKWLMRLRSIRHTLRHEEKIHELTVGMKVFVSTSLLPEGTDIVYPKPRWHHYWFAWWKAMGRHHATSYDEIEG